MKYPHITVQLIGNDGNAFAIIGNVVECMKRAGVPKVEVDAFFNEATAGDYDNLLTTCIKWVNVQ